MTMRWIDPRVEFSVIVYTSGPLDPPFSGQAFNLTNWGDRNYVDGLDGIETRRGRSDQFQGYESGSCSFTLLNNKREFDATRTEIALDAPGSAGAGASTPDVTELNPASADLYVKVRLSLDNWVPGGSGQYIIGQFPGAPQNSWVFGISSTGRPQLDYTTDGSTGLVSTATQGTGFKPGSTHWLDMTLDRDNGAAGRTVTFRMSEDGFTWTTIGTPVTTAGTVSLFNSTGALLVGGGSLPLAGQVYEADVRIGGEFGAVAASPRFDELDINTTSFTDGSGRAWSITGTGRVGYDDKASVFAPILKPRRQVVVAATLDGNLSTFSPLFVGFIDGWPQTWDTTTSAVQIVAHDALTVLAQTTAEEGAGALVLDSVFQGQLDEERLAGDLPQQFTGERITSLIQLAGLSPQWLSLQTGLTEVVALQPRGDVLGLCQEAEVAEAGFFFVDRSGTVTFYDRHSRFKNDRLMMMQATYTDLQYAGLSVDYSTTQMWNDARFTRPPLDEADEPHEAIDVDDQSVHDHGRKTYRKTIPVVSDGETLARAQFWVMRYGKPRARPSPITIRPRKDLTDLFLSVARAELLDHIHILRTPLGLQPTIRFMGLVEQVEHRITNTDWWCTLATSPVDMDDGANCLTLDDADLGQLDQEVLCY